MEGSQQVEEFSAVQAPDVGAVPVLAAGQGSAALGAGAEFTGWLFWFQVVSPGICVLTVGSGGKGPLLRGNRPGDGAQCEGCRDEGWGQPGPLAPDAGGQGRRRGQGCKPEMRSSCDARRVPGNVRDPLTPGGCCPYPV